MSNIETLYYFNIIHCYCQMEKSTPSTHLNTTGLNKFFWPLIIFSGLIFTVFAAAIFYFGLNMNKSGLKISLTPQIIGRIAPAGDLPTGLENQSLFTRTGKVIALEGKTFYLESVYTQDDNIMKAVFKAKVNSESTFIARDISELSKMGPFATETTGATPIRFQDIKVGDTVTVFSGVNIKDETEFSAQKVEKRYSS